MTVAPPAAAEAGGRRRVAFAILRAAAVVAIGVFLVWQIRRDWPAVAALRFRATPHDLALATAAGVAGLVLLPAAFTLTLRRVGLYRPAHRWFYGRIWLQAYLYRYVPGKVMLVAERVRLGARAGIGAGESVLLVVWETLLLMVGAALVLVLLFGFAAGGAGDRLWPIAGGALAVGLLVAFPPALRWLAGRWPRLAALGVLRLRPRDQLALAAVYGAAWLCLGASFFFACRIFVDLPLDLLPTVEFWFVGGYVAGLVAAVAPAGLGVREGIVAAGLAGTVGAGEAAAVAIAGRLWMTAIELVCIAVARAIPAPEEDR